MYLKNPKKSSDGYFRVGYDEVSNKYLLETADSFGNNRYFVITKEQYQWADIAPSRLEMLKNKCLEENDKSEVFFFSTWEKENTYEQNKLMWKYTYRGMLIGKDINEIHRKIGCPNATKCSDNDNKVENYVMSMSLEIEVVYVNNVCIDVKVNWKK